MKQQFSVLIPVYNQEKPEFFDAALRSVVSNTVQPTEIVICKDGKLSKPLEQVINKYRQEHPVKIIASATRRGLGPTLRNGVLACQNEIIFRMDADDICQPDRFAEQLAAFHEQDADVVGSNILEYDEQMASATGRRVMPAKHKDILAIAKRRNPMNHMTVAFKKSQVLSAGNYKTMPGFEDYYLWVRMLQQGSKFYNVQADLVKVRGGSALSSRRGGIGYAKSVARFEKKLLQLGFISRREYLENLLARIPVSLAPVGARSLVYSKFLREQRV